MTLEPMLRLMAGVFVTGSVLLTMFVHPYFLWFTVFVGLNLVQSGFTNWCPMIGPAPTSWREGGRDAARAASLGVIEPLP